MDKAEEQALTEREKPKYLKWSEILAAVDRIQAKPDVSDEQKLLLLFYTQMPPMRADFANLVVYKRSPTKATGNYIVSTAKHSHVVINEHKTAKAHGAIRNDLPPALHKAVKKYLDDHSVGVLFKTNEKNLSDMVIRAMKKETGKRVGINIFRHSYISELKKDEAPLKEKKKVATAMGHTPATAEYYRRVD
jgi:hypothetical protein